MRYMREAPGTLLKQARQRAGLTQTELAERLETSQSVVARLESPRANPRFHTLERAIAATGHSLEASLTESAYPALDESLIAQNLRADPAARLRRFMGSYRRLRRLSPVVRAADG
jgi:transcriptional regulator with XRE-family HTH domain